MKSPLNWLSKSHIYKKYSSDPGNMLVHTGVIGWILSSAAQIFAIAINDKISKKDKMFLIPQECADAFVNCLSFYVVTSSLKAFGKRLTRTAKLRTPEVSQYLKDKGYVLEKGAQRVKDKIYAGDWNFDITKLDCYNTEFSKEATPFKNGATSLKAAYKPFNNGVEVVTGLVGSILSSNLITPIFRNSYAARKQKQFMAYDEKHNPKKAVLPLPNKITMGDYQKLATTKTYSGNLKI